MAPHNLRRILLAFSKFTSTYLFGLLLLAGSCLSQQITATGDHLFTGYASQSDIKAGNTMVASLSGDSFINKRRIGVAVNAAVAEASAALFANCPIQLSQLILDNCTGVGINTTPEANAILDLGVLGTNIYKYVKFNSPSPYGLRIGVHQSGAQFLAQGATKTGIDANYIAITGDNTLVNHSAIEFEFDGRIAFLGQLHQPDGTVLSMQPSLTLSPTGQVQMAGPLVIGPNLEPNAAMQVTWTTDKWLKLNGVMRIGSMQSGVQFLSVGVAKSAADENYVANSSNNTLVNHSSLEFGYNGWLSYLVAPHQNDGTVLNNLFTAAFRISGSPDVSFGHMGIGAWPSANQLEVGGNLHIASGGLIFPDGSLQTKAQVAGPQGPQGPAGTQGPTGPQGPPGPTGPITFSAHCAGTFFSGDSVVLNPLGQTTAQYCSSLYRGITVLYQGEFGEAQGGNFSIYTDTGNTKVDTQYGFAAPRAGTLTNLRITAITKGSASTSGRVLVRKIRTDNTIDNNSSDVNLTCTVGTGTSCSDTTHTLAISAGERILVTAYTASAETLTSLSVLVDLQ